jgi:hypothetical protein
MAARDFTLTITAAAQRLSAAIPTVSGAAGPDEAYRQIFLTTETDCFIGGSSALTTSNYGYKVVAAQTLPLVIGPFTTGPVKLSDLWVIGTSGKLHIFGIPF